MSANILTAPATATATQFAATGGTETGTALPLPGNGADSPFAALFQEMLGKQAATALPGLATEELQAATGTEMAEDLNALMPFLEAMGLIQTDIQAKTESSEEQLIEIAAPDTAFAAPTAVPGMNMPAISAAIAEGEGKNGESTGIAVPLETSTGNALTESVGTQTSAPGETAAGNDFAAQLSSAVEGKQEQMSAQLAETNIPTANHLPSDSLHPAGQPANTRTSLPVTETVGSPAWNEDIGNKVVWMANRMESKAELVLTPPQMGRIEVSLAVTGDNATASFVSNNPAVREALESALPRLREVLAEAGIQLGQAQVGAENARQFSQQQKNGDNFNSDREAARSDEIRISASPGPSQSATGLKMGRGLVDVFA